MNKIKRTKKSSKEEQSEINYIIDQQLGEYKESFNNGSISSILKQIKIDVKCKSENQKKLVNSIKDNDVTICNGPSGTGKTYLACAQSLRLLKDYPEKYKKILLVKSITQLKGEDPGILPGDEYQKFKFIMMSYMDSFYKLIGEFNTHKLIEHGIIKYELLGSMRGRSFNNIILISDEHQNINIDNTRTLLTRISEDSKYILMGDGEQIDLKNKKDSSLEIISKKIKENPIEGVGIVNFDDNDIVRHRLTSYFLNLFRNE